jgi:hypothetical protein
MDLVEVSSFEYGILLCPANHCLSTETPCTSFNTNYLLDMLDSFMNYDNMFQPLLSAVFVSFIYL